MTRIRILLTFLLLAAPWAVAQEFRATISGIVRDSSGAIVPGAKIAVTSLERGISSEAVSNDSGRYIVQFLIPGAYKLTAEHPGFKTYTREGIKLEAADRAAIDVILEVGGTADTVTVTADISTLQTETASRTTTVDNSVVDNVPAGTRNVMALQYTQAGVIKASTYWGTMGITAWGNMNSVTIGGGVKGENESVVDGVTATQSDRGIAFVPPMSTTEQVTIQTNSYDAQYGRVGGGITLLNLKSGTNAFHGQAFESNITKSTIAMPWEANKAGLKKKDVTFINNNFGFQVDGPVYIPKLVDGRNKVFFMLSYEGETNRQTGGQIYSVPLAEQRQGDFSGLYTAISGKTVPVTIFDPLTTTLAADGKSYTRSAFPGNKIPQNRINPVSANLTKYYPNPTWEGDGPGHLGNYMNFMPQTGSLHSWLGKMDIQLTQKSRLSFRSGQSDNIYWQKRVWGTNAAEPSSEWPGQRVARNWAADWTYMLNSRMVLNLRGGLSRNEGFGGNGYAKGFDPRELGFPDALVSQFTTLQFPRFNVNEGYSPLGATSVTDYSTHDTYSAQPNLSITAGRHFLKLGGEFRLYNDNRLQPGSAAGLYNFDRGWTIQNPAVAVADQGNSYASFLMGYPSATPGQISKIDRNMDPAYSNRYYALFIQDDWKITSKLTLNLGLRWDYETPRYERYDRMVRGFDFNVDSPLQPQVPSLDLNGGIMFAGVNGNSRYSFDTYKNNFQPRFGAAYQLSPKWVLRGGWALSYLGQSSNGPATGFSVPTELVASLTGGLTPAVSLSDPFPRSIFPNGLLVPPGSSTGLSTLLGQAIGFQYLERELPYSQQFSFGVQHELPGAWMIDASYVGNFTNRMPVSMGLNNLSLATLESVPVAQRQTYFLEQIDNPMKGLLPGSSLNASKLPRQNLLMPYPQYTSMTVTDVPIGKQRYHSLALNARHRFSKGFSLTVNYTISKNLEQVNVLNGQDVNLADFTKTPLERRITEFDIPQKLAVIGTWDLPFGRKRAYFSNMNPILDGIVGGWSISGQSVVQSGFPFAFPNAAPLEARSAKLTDAERDERARAAGRDHFDPSIDKWFDTTLFGKTAGPAPYTLRAFPTRFPDVRSEAFFVMDVAIYKEFVFAERVRLQLRMDGQNLTNHPWMSKLRTNNVTDSRFGQLDQSMSNVPRMLSLGFKVLF